MKLKIKDIAKMADVSISTVSLALNNKPGISQETRERILKIVQQGGYVHKSFLQDNNPDQAPLGTKVVNFVACTNPGIVIEQYESLPFFTKLIKHIGEYLFSKGYSLMFSTINMENLYEEIRQIGKDNGRAGIILLGTDLTKEQISFISQHLPNIVVLDTCFESLNVDFVNMNSLLGAYQAANYFADLGHTRIGYVQSNVRIKNFELRKQGFEMALLERNLNILDKDYFSMLPTVIYTSQEHFKKEVSKRMNDMPTALFCESDYMAISLIKSLTELGIDIPGQISVIGFDNIQEANIITPELTTVHVQTEKMAALAVDRVLEMMENKAGTKMKYIVDTEIVERNSCRAIERT